MTKSKEDRNEYNRQRNITKNICEDQQNNQ